MLPIWLLAELTVMIYYWRFWEPWAGSMLVVLLPKFWFWIGNHDWHNCFWMSLWLFVGWIFTGPKKASKSRILYDRLNKEKNSWSMLPIWLLAELMIMIYYWRFWEPWAGSMLVVLLPKLWFWIRNHDWHNCFWMSLWLFVGWMNPYWTQKSFKIKNFIW